MSENAEIFSIRIVVADFYMEKPIPKLDPCYSEFRGKEVKKVPVIRIFGSNAYGQKTCMHIHAVFPYFYIPYESKDFESLNKGIYQIAFNIDKAINISLGQTQSATQHVFKIQLVKGIPFYGYHRCEHQYLKIYMYNPRFVRRAANLLQNGSVLGKVFHPHESHVPYVLQFMIDYNLYGMSFLHVPLEIVKFRRNNEEDIIPFAGTYKRTQILNSMVAKKQSCSSLEVDIGSSFILNRFQLVAKGNKTKHSNPGVEAIWHDEDVRRRKLISSLGDDEEKINAIPSLEIPATQERPNIQATESDTFYRVGLLSKLITIENSLSENSSVLDQTLNTTVQPSQVDMTLNVGNLSKKELRRTFNLRKLLANSVYPEECTQDENLVDASCIENHLSGRSFTEINSTDSTPSQKCDVQSTPTLDESEFLDDTIVDEEILLNCAQDQQHVPLNATLRDEDMAVLEVLQQLEEQNEDKALLEALQKLEEINELDNPVDLDSSLAPLSQPHHNFELTPNLLDKETIALANSQILNRNDSEPESESENEGDSHLQDFSIILDDIDELLLKISQSQTTAKTAEMSVDNLKLPQVDGVDDLLPNTPEKLVTNRSGCRNQTTPPRSPRTPKKVVRSPRTPKSNAASRYAPLPLIITNRFVKKNLDETTTSVGSDCGSSNTRPRSPLPLRRVLAMTKMRRKTISSSKELRDMLKPSDEKESNANLQRSRKNSVDLEKTHVTCALTPVRRSERLLKFCNVDTVPKNTDNPKRENSKSGNPKKNVQTKNKSKKDPSKNSYGLKKVLVRIPKINLEKLAKDLKSSKKKLNESLNSENDSHDKREIVVNNENVERMDGPVKKSETEPVSHIAGDNIKRNLSQLLKVFQPSRDISDTKDHSEKSHSNPSGNETTLERTPEEKLKINSLSGIAKRLPLSLNWYRSKKDKNSTLQPTTKSDKQDLSEDNIRKNLSELMRALQSTNRSMTSEEKGIYYKPNELKFVKEVDQTVDSSLESLRMCESTDKNPGSDEEIDEEIAASDTEVERTSLKMKRTPSFKRLRRSFCAKISEGTQNVIGEHSLEEIPSTSKNVSQTLLDLSVTVNSPSVFSEYSSPAQTPKETKVIEPLVKKYFSSQRDVVILKPLLLPPTREEILKCCEKLQIYEYEFLKPFYSNPDDITKAKEVGFTVLQIPGNKLSDCAEFESVLGANCGGLADWRRKKLLQIGCSQILQRYRNVECAREFFATKKQVIIQPHLHPPSRHDAKIWLKAKELLEKGNAAKKSLLIDQDSPIKIRRQKVTMMFSDETAGGSEDTDGMDCTICSLTLTPMTPAAPLRQSDEQSSNKNDLTPLSTIAATVTPETASVSKKSRRSIRRKSVKTSLHEKLRAAINKEMVDEEKLKDKNHEAVIESSESLPASQHSNISSNDSSSIASEVVLDELERSSFVKLLQSNKHKDQLNISFGLSCATLNNTFGFKVNLENLQEAKADVECNNLTSIAMELFVMTREDLCPNPEFDEVHCIFYAIENNISTLTTQADPECTSSIPLGRKACGYILVNDSDDIMQNEGKIHGLDTDIEVKIVKTEIEALETLLELCALWDPDIYAGYEIEMSSWGYLIDRSKYLCLNIAPLLSRVPSQKVRDFVDEDRDQFTDLDVEMKLCGRILLDVWRLMRSEIALTSYTFENVMYHILHKRCPSHNYKDLTTWFKSPCSRWIVLEYYLERVRGIMALLDQLDLLGRTSEMAKLIGIQFYEVLSRGSQFRVESMMLRIAKPRNLVPLSPSVQQRAHMRAPEYLPLILEPQSRFYADPLIVLDFQSLYPSMIIAYNYCFSTCLGRVEHLGQSTPFEFGASQLRVSPAMLRKLVDDDLVNISPCGVVFVKASVREGILPRMLTEILDTRLMVKQSMKLHKSNSALQRILHSRQLGLKLMANVTYGYTAANFSGRMPAVEVGDSVVAKGRETLERTIKMVEENEKWGVKVVYGDTDSLFVLVPGRNREQAFKIGEEIAAAATKENPHPVKLKLEKVYQPCILQTKKRYVGYMYETPDQTDPIYEAKGIETVRRDGCPAVAKMLEKVLRILFETADVSQVKQYVCRQFTKLLSGRANLQDLIFAKEFRGLNGYRPTACVPALELTRKWIQIDPRRIPRRGERVPFIITNGPPGVPLIRLVRSPYDVLADGGLKINSIYYITKAIIPPLNRCLLLIGADANEWFANLPRKILMTPALSTANEMISTNQQKKSTISQYFSATNCVIECGRHTKEGICNVCTLDATKCVVVLNSKIAKIERAFHLTQQICQVCCGRVGDLKCNSLDCPVLYVFEVKRRDLQQIVHFRKLLEKF